MKYIFSILVIILTTVLIYQKYDVLCHNNTCTVFSREVFNDFLYGGSWEGKVSHKATKELDFLTSGELFVIVLNCGKKREIWTSKDGDLYDLVYDDYHIYSESGNQIWLKIISRESWIETQIWSFVNIDDERLSVQWNRMVSNITLSTDDDERTYGKLGYGELYKISDQCNIFPD